MTTEKEVKGKKITKLDKAAQELLRIANRNSEGMLEPEEVVERARSRTSPLHSYFEWDDNKAGHAYRLWQARQLISITELPGPDQTSERVFVSLKSDRAGGRGYRKMIDVLSNKQLRAELLKDAFQAMEDFKTRYAELKELVEVFDAMSTAEKRLYKRVAEASAETQPRA